MNVVCGDLFFYSLASIQEVSYHLLLNSMRFFDT